MPLTAVLATPLARYQAAIQQGQLQQDALQYMAVEKLNMLHGALQGYVPDRRQAWQARLISFWREKPHPPQGLYLWGDVGRGKSMLMDLFYQTVATPFKRRCHFHEFMLEIHAQLHQWRQGKMPQAGTVDPLPYLARQMVKNVYVLCFDEFHVTDVADAMILQRLFAALFAEGMIVVATSNRKPDDLYKDGLQRQNFLPFIALLQQQLEVVELNGDTDYRLRLLAGRDTFFSPDTPENQQKLQALFLELTEGEEGHEDILLVKTRQVHIPKAAAGVAFFHFHELCGVPMGVADYIALASHYNSILVQSIPIFTADLQNEAKRFLLLLDALYEAKIHFACTAATAPENLYHGGLLSFEFARTVSRLQEMRYHQGQ